MTPLLLSLILSIEPGSITAPNDLIQSDRNGMFEFKMGPMTPLIDRDFTSTRPYSTTFGAGGKSLWMLIGEIEFEWQFFQKFGSLAVGVSVGYGEKYAHTIDANGNPSTDATGLKIYPLQALLAYRWDYAFQRWSVPLVPYVKGGFMLVPWQIFKGNKVEVDDGISAQNVNYGLAFTAGLSLMLDFLDRRLARDFDNSMGVNHTYLFAEWTYQEINDFGAKNSSGAFSALDLSNRHWMFGLALEF